MNYTKAENLIDKNPEAAKRFYDLVLLIKRILRNILLY